MNTLKSKEFFSLARFLKTPVIATQQGEKGYCLCLEQSEDGEVRTMHMATMVDGADGKKIEGLRFFSSLGSIETLLRKEKISKLFVKLEDTDIAKKRGANPAAMEALEKARQEKKSGKK